MRMFPCANAGMLDSASARRQSRHHTLTRGPLSMRVHMRTLPRMHMLSRISDACAYAYTHYSSPCACIYVRSRPCACPCPCPCSCLCTQVLTVVSRRRRMRISRSSRRRRRRMCMLNDVMSMLLRRSTQDTGIISCTCMRAACARMSLTMFIVIFPHMHRHMNRHRRMHKNMLSRIRMHRHGHTCACSVRECAREIQHASVHAPACARQ